MSLMMILMPIITNHNNIIITSYILHRYLASYKIWVLQKIWIRVVYIWDIYKTNSNMIIFHIKVGLLFTKKIQVKVYIKYMIQTMLIMIMNKIIIIIIIVVMRGKYYRKKLNYSYRGDNKNEED